jgi:hypothetical protein
MLERRTLSSPPVLFARRAHQESPNNNKNNKSRSRAMSAVASVAMCFAFTLATRRGQSLSIHIKDTTKEPRTLPRTPHVMDMNFDSAFQVAYDEIMVESKKSCRPGGENLDDIIDCYTRKRVDLNTFPFKSRGGLSNTDRQLLSETYFNADSVFEFGIGESTAIAAETNLPRYAGVDSSAEWITTARSHAPDRFRFSFADVGPTREWGQPVSNKTLAKMALDYQIAPLFVERDPFDVYFVDGRWRVACVMTSFLHAIHTGGDLNRIRVVLHDYDGRGGPEGSYGAVESIATIEKRSEKAVVLAKRRDVTAADIFNTWQRFRHKKT